MTSKRFSSVPLLVIKNEQIHGGGGEQMAVESGWCWN
jgi:hypothetical protein